MSWAFPAQLSFGLKKVSMEEASILESTMSPGVIAWSTVVADPFEEVDEILEVSGVEFDFHRLLIGVDLE